MNNAEIKVNKVPVKPAIEVDNPELEIQLTV